MNRPAHPRRPLHRALLAGALALAGAAHAQSTDPAALARQALDLMDAGDYTQVEMLFAPRMAAMKR